MINTNKIIYRPIGVIHSSFWDQEGMPIQPAVAQGKEERVRDIRADDRFSKENG